MVYIPENKKFAELSGVRVFHDHKTNTIKLISTDEDLVGKPFSITLNQGTETEATLRELLEDSGIIREHNSSTKDDFYGVPKFVTLPPEREIKPSKQMEFFKNTKISISKVPSTVIDNIMHEKESFDKVSSPSKNGGNIIIDFNNETVSEDSLASKESNFAFGEAQQGEIISHDFFNNPNLLVVGNLGSGITMIEKGLGYHIAKYTNEQPTLLRVSDSPVTINPFQDKVMYVSQTLERLKEIESTAFYRIDQSVVGEPLYVVLGGIPTPGSRPQEAHEFGQIRSTIKNILKLSRKANMRVILFANQDRFSQRFTPDILELFQSKVLVGQASEEVLSTLSLPASMATRDVQGSAYYLSSVEPKAFQSFYYRD